MATRNGVEVRFTADNSDLLRAIKQNIDAFADMRRRVDQDLNAIDTSVREFGRTVNTAFDGLNNTLRTTGTRLDDTARRLDNVGDEADQAARSVRNLDSALAGLARFGAISVGGVGGIPTVIPGAGVVGAPVGFTTGGAAAAAAAAGVAGGAFRGGTSSQFTHVQNIIGGPPPVGGGAAIAASVNLAGAAAIGATGAFPKPAGLFRGPDGRIMSAKQAAAATGQGEIIEGEFVRPWQGMPGDPTMPRTGMWSTGPRLGAGLGGFGGATGLAFALGAVPPIAGGFRGSILGGGGDDWFTNPLTGARLGGPQMAEAFLGRMPVDIHAARTPRGLPDPSSPDFNRRYGGGLGGVGGAAISGRAAADAIKGLAGAAAVAGAGIAAGLAVGIASVVMLKDNVKAAVDEFVAAEASQFRMQFAFDAAGLGEYVDEFQRWNEERAKIIPFDDDTLADVEQVLARTFGTPDELKRFTTLVTDVAAGTGKSVDTIASALVKFRTTGTGRIFSELGIQIRGLDDELLDADTLFGALEDRFGGAAEAAGQLAGGQLAILDNRLGEVSETLGEKLAPAWINFRIAGVQAAELVVEKLGEFGEAAEDAGIDTDGLKDSFSNLGTFLQGEMSDAWNGLLGWVKDNREEINNFLGDVAFFVDESGPALAQLIGIVGDAFKETADKIMAAANAIRAFMEWYDRLPGEGPVGLEDLGPRADSSGVIRGGATATGTRPRGLFMHDGGRVTGGAVGQEVLRVLQVGETVTPIGGSAGSMRPIMIYTSGSRYQRVLLEDFAQAARGQGLQVVVK